MPSVTRFFIFFLGIVALVVFVLVALVAAVKPESFWVTKRFSYDTVPQSKAVPAQKGVTQSPQRALSKSAANPRSNTH